MQDRFVVSLTVAILLLAGNAGAQTIDAVSRRDGPMLQAIQEGGTALPAFAQPVGIPITLREAVAGRVGASAGVESDTTPRWLDEAIEREAQRLSRGPSGVPAVRQSPPKRGWIKRHPIFTGAFIGFGTGFIIGYSQGDDGVLYDFTAMANGVFLGWVGAGVGAAAGAIAGAILK